MSRDRSRITGGRPPRTVWLALLAVIVVPVAVAWGAFDRGAEPVRSLDPAAAAAATPSEGPTARSSSQPSSRPGAESGKPEVSSSGTPTSSPSIQAEEAPPTVEPAERPGQELDPELEVADRGFGRPGTYPDGVKVAVTSIDQTTVEGMGTGSTSGPVTVFTLRVDNGSGEPIDLSSVVLTAAYGEGEGLLAYPTYDVPTSDLFGVVKPGASARGVYAFSIPAAERDRVMLHVDLDGTRVPALFEGDTRR